MYCCREAIVVPYPSFYLIFLCSKYIIYTPSVDEEGVWSECVFNVELFVWSILLYWQKRLYN
jgi:hypothetical protein